MNKTHYNDVLNITLLRIMIQAIVKKGKVIPENISLPQVSAGTVLIKVVNSCISAGTELSNVGETGKPLLKRAMDKPDEVKQVIDFIKQNGLRKTIAKVRGALDGGKPIGYSISGVVVKIGQEITKFKKGDFVAAAGMGLANHAEYVNVPSNLVMKMPDDLDFIKASTVTLGGIAMQGVRRTDLKLGEFCVIVGAGVLGLLAQQMLQLSGIRTIVTDLDEYRLAIAKKLGAEMVLNPSKVDIVTEVHNLTGNYGADAVLFAAATSHSQPLSESFKMCKKKGKVVLMGVVGMEINRGDMYQKELDFLMSTSYGPGRYDPKYEEKGQDYPYAYVRWTENRNMEEYLRLLKGEHIQIDGLISDVYPIKDVQKAYEALNLKGREKPLISILDYGVKDPFQIIVPTFSEKIKTLRYKEQKKKIQVAIVGTGIFAASMHLPNLKKLASLYQIRAIMNRTGQKASAFANQYQAAYSTTDLKVVLEDEKIDLVFITTRHDTHAAFALSALKAGKHVFLEKPLATNQTELNQIKAFYQENPNTEKPILMVGFNRRFSSYLQEIKKHTDTRVNPLFIHYRMNAGFIPLDHWVHEHGGRIIGETCHLIDLLNFLTDAKISEIHSVSLTPNNQKFSDDDNRSIILKYTDGSVATIHYFATGNKKFSKEQMEVHFDGKTILLEDYKKLTAYGLSIKSINSSISQKGQLEELKALYQGIKTGVWPIELADMIQTTEASFLIKNE